LDALASTQKLEEFINILTPTDYGKSIAELNEHTPLALSRIFNKILIQRFKNLINIPSEDLQYFLLTYSRRLEIKNLSRILRGVSAGVPRQEISDWLINLNNISRIDFGSLLDAGSVNEVITLLKGTIYKDLKKYLPLWNEYHSVLIFESQLHSIYYQQVLNSLGFFFGETKDFLNTIIGLESDLANCFFSLSSLLYGYTDKFVEMLLIPFSQKLSISTYKNAIQAKTPQTALAILQPYKTVVEHILNKREDLAEAEGLKLLRAEASKGMREAYIELPYVIGYLTHCELECRDLTNIALSIEYGLNPKDSLSFSI
jgi:vacuolar-type H+-ATPase subunit C/Vma6